MSTKAPAVAAKADASGSSEWYYKKTGKYQSQSQSYKDKNGDGEAWWSWSNGKNKSKRGGGGTGDGPSWKKPRSSGGPGKP